MEIMAQPKNIVIKKYENRRLYDTANSRYVNLDEVAAMLQNGDNVQVIDSATGEDITRLILTQIIVEDAKSPSSTFPLDVLRQMVIASGRAGQESTLRYMKAMLDIYQNTYRVMTPPVNPFEFIQRRDQPPGPFAAPFAAPFVEPSSAPAADPRSDAAYRPAPESGASEVDELKRRLQELEQMVSSLGVKKPAKPKP